MVFKKLLAVLLTIILVGSLQSMEPGKVVTETISGNLKAACPEFGKGFQKVGLGLSRFVLDSSQRFAQAGQFCADHYLLTGLGMAGLVYFYLYVWPEVHIDITYSNHPLVRVHHPHAQNNRR